MCANKSIVQKDLLHFIELYKGHPVVWDMSSAMYRRNDLKIKAYEAMSAETKMSVEEVKKKIKSIRTSYGAEKAKVEKSMRSGCAADSVYQPTVFWYNEMAFLDSSIIRRKTTDDAPQVDVTPKDIKLEPSCSVDESFSDSIPSGSRKRKHSPPRGDKLNFALEKLANINKRSSKYESFGESVINQLTDLPAEGAYKAMQDIQTILTKHNLFHLRNKVFTPIVEPSRTSTPCSNSSSNDIIFYAMSDADITDADI